MAAKQPVTARCMCFFALPCIGREGLGNLVPQPCCMGREGSGNLPGLQKFREKLKKINFKTGEGENHTMELKRIDGVFTVCKVIDYTKTKLDAEFCFTGKTDEELSLVCLTEDTPDNTTERDNGWKAFRIQGVLDFSLIGILSKISGILADNKIGIFAVSTFNTDYILVKEENYEKALEALAKEGYAVV